MKKAKPRRVFIIFDDFGNRMGHGTYYPFGGNCQVYFKRQNYAAIQLSSLGDVMLFEGVRGMDWKDERSKNNGQSENETQAG